MYGKIYIISSRFLTCQTFCFLRHLIGFLIFLALTVFTAMMIPSDGSPSILHSLSSTCLALPLKGDEFKNSVHSAEDVLPPLSGWKIPQILLNCLPKKFHHNDNLTDPCILVNP